MKLQTLTIHNIASIIDATIPFSEEPLANSDVYLITGETGVGKTTILDAICLALYGTTPRAAGGNTTRIQDGDDEITTQNPCNFLRRNTYEGFATLTFEGNDGENYEITWKVKRARKNVNGKFKSERLLKRTTGEQYTWDAAEQVKEKIKEIIGLDFKQFCRTRMLAQGEFTKFLKSEENEKAEILEKITGTDIYKQIGQAIYERTQTKQRAFDELQKQMGNIICLTQEERAEKTNEQKRLNKEIMAEEARSKEAADKKKWLEQQNILEADKTKADNALQEALRQKESATFKQDEQTIEQWKQTVEVRTALTDADDAATQLRKCEQTLQDMETTFKTLCGGRDYLQQAQTARQAKLNDVETFLAAEQPRAEVYANAQTIQAQLKNMLSNQKRRDEANQEKAKQEGLKSTLKQKQTEAAEKEQSAENALKQKQQEEHDLREKLEAANASELRNQKDKYALRLQQISTAERSLRALREAQTRAKTNAEELEKAEAEARDLSAKEQSLKAEVAKAEAEAKKCEQGYNLLKNAAAYIREMQLDLHVGSVCPVCQQTIAHEVHREENSDAGVEQALSLFKQAKTQLETQKKAYDQASIAAKAKAGAAAQMRRNIEADHSLEAAQEQARTDCEACGLTNAAEQTEERLQELKTQTQTQADKIADALREVDELANKAEAARREVERLQAARDEAKTATSNVRLELSKCEQAIQNAAGNAQKYEAERIADAKAVEQALGQLTWQNDWRTATSLFQNELNESARKYTKNLETQKGLEAEIESKKFELTNIDESIAGLVALRPQWKGAAPAAAQPVEGLNGRLSNLRGQLQATCSEQQTAAQAQQRANAQVATFCQEHAAYSPDALRRLNAFDRQKIELLEAAHTEVEKSILAAQTRNRTAADNLKAHEAKRPTLAADDTLPQLNERIDQCAEHIRTFSQEIGRIRQEIKADDEKIAAKSAHKEESEKLEADLNKWNKLRDLFGDSTGNKFRKIAQRFVLEQLIGGANHFLRQLTNRYELEVLDDRFIIYVRDNYMGCERRHVNTISGGESFLVSLALALALSQLDGNTSVDHLFIDEGFGSLSDNALNQAITTLNSLHKELHCHVGIISHVEQLKEKLPIQIRVSITQNGAASEVNVSDN